MFINNVKASQGPQKHLRPQRVKALKPDLTPLAELHMHREITLLMITFPTLRSHCLDPSTRRSPAARL